ncbi:hypothetical protein BV898_14918 [Hypsibius exemplaris]|uniref:Shematrin-like protein 1 n=1 Tax=Hypsibius exemplaris TaxID=2072580 RepID=A0A9X6NBJ6_HYPEX|nr:hypothetical protein BV898_14918 [Hypsibius exemplaris]
MHSTERVFLLLVSTVCFIIIHLTDAQTYGGYGGALGGYAIGGSLSNFYGNCTRPASSSYGSGGYGSSSYGSSYYTSVSTTPAPSTLLPNCGFDADSARVFGYYGYDFPKPPIGITYPNIGWPYSIPNPYYTPPPYGPIGLPYYGVPVTGYNPYLWGFGSYNGIYGAARGGKYAIPEVAPTYQPSNVLKGYKFGPGGQIISYY